MSSRVFAAKSSHRPSDPQLCGLCDITGCSPIVKGEMCLYLTCLGDNARPAAQIERGEKEDNYATGFRVVPSGKKRLVSPGTRWERMVPIFKWQQRGQGDQWHDIVVWERLVHADCARQAGYRVSGKQTEAIRGRRTQGHAHVASAVPESPLMDLARVMLVDTAEDLGVASPEVQEAVASVLHGPITPPEPPPVNEMPEDEGIRRFRLLEL